MSNHHTNSDAPLVSAIIPTRDRPDLLAGAIRSAFRQTWRQLEVIVVVDGPDETTGEYLEAIHDPRLRVIYLPERRGGSDARNAGVRAACGEWIAFLDDDDEWLPEKIERQMRAAHAMPDWFPVVSCRLIAQSPTTSRVLPPRPYSQPEPIAEFLFCRSSLRDPGGVMQSSTLLAPRELLLAVPFRSGLAMHQDWDWLIRIASYKGVVLSMVPQPLATRFLLVRCHSVRVAGTSQPCGPPREARDSARLSLRRQPRGPRLHQLPDFRAGPGGNPPLLAKPPSQSMGQS
jgi:glycosyltransferase involved in cell wall biosynthesis